MKRFYNIAVKISFIMLFLTIFISIIGDSSMMGAFNFTSVKTAEFGTYFLYFLIMSKSLYFILRKLKVSKDNKVLKFLQQNNKYQREEGLIVFNILFIHAYIDTIKNINIFSIVIFNYLTVLIPVLILIYMEITSFSYFQDKIKSWKKTHTIIWIALPLILLHVILVSDNFLKYFILTLVILIIALVESILDIKKGVRHLSYIAIGFLLAGIQFKTVKAYEEDMSLNLVSSNDQSDNDQSEDFNISSDYKEDEEDDNLEYTYPTTTTDNTSTTTTDNTSTTTNDNTMGDTTNISSEDESEDTKDNSSGGVIYNDGTYEGSARGHKGLITVNTTIQNDDIIDIEVVSENEDPPWWQPVEQNLIPQIIENDSIAGIDYIAGSTHSSQGLLNAVEQSLDNAKI